MRCKGKVLLVELTPALKDRCLPILCPSAGDRRREVIFIPSVPRVIDQRAFTRLNPVDGYFFTNKM